MAKQFDDIKRVKVGATVVAPIAPQSAPVSRLFANPFAKENGTVAPKPFSETVREIKPGFFVPRAALPQRLENETAKKTGETRTPPPARSSQDYFSSLSSHSVHVARANFCANVAPPARMILSGNAKNGTASKSGQRSQMPLNIPLSLPSAPQRSFPSVTFFSVLVIIILLSGVFFGMNYFASARITLTPRQETVSVSGTFTAERDEQSGAELLFETMSVPGEVSSEIPADDERAVDERATGTIVIYNNYSATPQRLIKNKRFATTDGKIFRAKDSVVVPGTTTENGKTVPGSVEAMAVADEPGEKYNIGLSDFTIPGFKGEPRYDKFYARSKTEMAGGFSGTKRFPSDARVAEARATLRAELSEKMAKSAEAQRPAGYVLFPGATRTVLADDASITVDGSSATITERGVISGAIFKSDDLFSSILQKSLATFDGGEVDIPDLKNLTFVFTEDPSFEANSISFSLSGSARTIWRVDTAGLARAIAGKPKKEFDEVLAAFANIRRAEASVSPFWLFDFPKDPARINIELVLE